MSTGWARRFDDPIKADGSESATLLDAGEFIITLPKKEHAAPEWQEPGWKP
jgi:hypothetical protein